MLWLTRSALHCTLATVLFLTYPTPSSWYLNHKQKQNQPKNPPLLPKPKAGNTTTNMHTPRHKSR